MIGIKIKKAGTFIKPILSGNATFKIEPEYKKPIKLSRLKYALVFMMIKTLMTSSDVLIFAELMGSRFMEEQELRCIKALLSGNIFLEPPN